MAYTFNPSTRKVEAEPCEIYASQRYTVRPFCATQKHHYHYYYCCSCYFS